MPQFYTTLSEKNFPELLGQMPTCPMALRLRVYGFEQPIAATITVVTVLTAGVGSSPAETNETARDTEMREAGKEVTDDRRGVGSVTDWTGRRDAVRLYTSLV